MKKIKDIKIFPGKRKSKYVRVQPITLDDLRCIFFPRNFYEKYRYLGVIPYDYSGTFELLEPSVIYADYLARPKWCPRWVLRFLHVFGNDGSVIRVRNRKLSDLFRRLTRGIMYTDTKTKWEYYDVRIYGYFPEKLNDLNHAITSYVYEKYNKIEMYEYLVDNGVECKPWWSSKDLRELVDKTHQVKEQLDELLDEKN